MLLSLTSQLESEKYRKRKEAKGYVFFYTLKKKNTMEVKTNSLQLLELQKILQDFSSHNVETKKGRFSYTYEWVVRSEQKEIFGP